MEMRIKVNGHNIWGNNLKDFKYNVIIIVIFLFVNLFVKIFLDYFVNIYFFVVLLILHEWCV